jgi:hypothetical protein
LCAALASALTFRRPGCSLSSQQCKHGTLYVGDNFTPRAYTLSVYQDKQDSSIFNKESEERAVTTWREVTKLVSPSCLRPSKLDLGRIKRIDCFPSFPINVGEMSPAPCCKHGRRHAERDTFFCANIPRCTSVGFIHVVE